MNPWKYAQLDPNAVQANRYLNPQSPPEPEPEPEPEPIPTSPTSLLSENYIEMPRANTYALGVQALQQACRAENNPKHPEFVKPDGSKVYRLLTFKETIIARLESYNSQKPGDERLALFRSWKDSCCGIAYQKKKTKFKLNLLCSELIDIDPAHNSSFLSIDYSRFSGVELDSSKGKYSQNLSLDEILNHPAWLAVMEGDKATLRAYCDVIFHELNNPAGTMGFYVLQNTAEDQLRAVYVNDLDYYSYAVGNNYLISSSRFLRVAPR